MTMANMIIGLKKSCWARDSSRKFWINCGDRSTPDQKIGIGPWALKRTLGERVFLFLLSSSRTSGVDGRVTEGNRVEIDEAPGPNGVFPRQLSARASPRSSVGEQKVQTAGRTVTP